MFEPVVLVLLSLATVGTAWCSYQAASWSGLSQRLTNLSAAASRRAVANQLQTHQLALLDVLLFSQHINAKQSSNAPLAQYYAERFRPEAKSAYDAWLLTEPYRNPKAPPHPFVTNFYQPRLLLDAIKEETTGQSYWQQAGEAGRVSRNYILITVLLASALFCGGTAPKLELVWARLGILAMGLGLIVFAAVRILMLPMQP